MICDAEGDMNIFEGKLEVTAAPYAEFLQTAKQETKESESRAKAKAEAEVYGEDEQFSREEDENGYDGYDGYTDIEESRAYNSGASRKERESPEGSISFMERAKRAGRETLVGGRGGRQLVSFYRLTPENQSLENRIKIDAVDSTNQLSDTVNWYFGRGETPYFAIYSTEDVDNPTILYASKDETAKQEAVVVKMFSEEWYNGVYEVGEEADTYNQSDGSSTVRGVGNTKQVIQTDNATGNDRMDIKESWRKLSAALRTVLKNTLKIPHSTGSRENRPLLAGAGGTGQQGRVDEAFSMNADVESVGNLVALHNLNSEKLWKSLKLGGFPMPSIAATKTVSASTGTIFPLYKNKQVPPPRRHLFFHVRIIRSSRLDLIFLFSVAHQNRYHRSKEQHNMGEQISICPRQYIVYNPKR